MSDDESREPKVWRVNVRTPIANSPSDATAAALYVIASSIDEATAQIERELKERADGSTITSVHRAEFGLVDCMADVCATHPRCRRHALEDSLRRRQLALHEAQLRRSGPDCIQDAAPIAARHLAEHRRDTAQERFAADRHVATAVKSPLTPDQGARMEQIATYGKVFYDAISISVPFGPYYLQALEHLEMALMLAAKGIAHEQRILGRDVSVVPCKCQSTLRVAGQASQCPRCGGES